jgi:hypothetical protein
MPRLPRLPVIWFGWYYVALRAENGRRLVTNSTDLAAFLRTLTATLQKQGARLHGGYVGEGEVHLALQMGENPVSAFTAMLSHSYARLFNGAHQESGPLFKPHPHVLLIQQPPWLIPLVHFIHWLPKRRAPESRDAGVWWSSDAVYRGRARMNGLVTTVVHRILARGSRSRQKQDEAYARRFDQEPDPADADRFLNGSPLDPRILGDDAFVSHVWELAGRRPARRRRLEARNDELIGRTLIGALKRLRRLSEDALPPLQAAAWAKTMTLENVCAMSRKHPLPMLRGLCVSYLLEQHRATRLQAARFFGCRPETLSAGRRRRHERTFRRLFNQPSSTLFERGRRPLVPSVIKTTGRETARDETREESDEVEEDSVEESDLSSAALVKRARLRSQLHNLDHYLGHWRLRVPRPYPDRRPNIIAPGKFEVVDQRPL